MKLRTARCGQECSAGFAIRPRTSYFQLTLAVSLVSPAEDALDLLLGHEFGAADGGCADENSRGLRRHKKTGQHRLGRAAQGNDPVAFQNNQPRNVAAPTDESIGLL